MLQLYVMKATTSLDGTCPSSRAEKCLKRTIYTFDFLVSISILIMEKNSINVMHLNKVRVILLKQLGAQV